MDFQNQIYNILRIYSKEYDESLVLKGLNGKSQNHNIQTAYYSFLLYNILKEKIIPESQQSLILGTLHIVFSPKQQNKSLYTFANFFKENMLTKITKYILITYIENNATIRLMDEAKRQTLDLYGNEEKNLYEINNLMKKIYEKD